MLTKTHSLNCIWAFQLAFADLVFPGMAGFAAYRYSLALFLSLLLSFSCVRVGDESTLFWDAFFPPESSVYRTVCRATSQFSDKLKYYELFILSLLPVVDFFFGMTKI